MWEELLESAPIIHQQYNYSTVTLYNANNIIQSIKPILHQYINTILYQTYPFFQNVKNKCTRTAKIPLLDQTPEHISPCSESPESVMPYIRHYHAVVRPIYRTIQYPPPCTLTVTLPPLHIARESWMLCWDTVSPKWDQRPDSIAYFMDSALQC